MKILENNLGYSQQSYSQEVKKVVLSLRERQVSDENIKLLLDNARKNKGNVIDYLSEGYKYLTNPHDPSKPLPEHFDGDRQSVVPELRDLSWHVTNHALAYEKGVSKTLPAVKLEKALYNVLGVLMAAEPMTPSSKVHNPDLSTEMIIDLGRWRANEPGHTL